MPASHSDVRARERQLRRAASAGMTDCTDPELAGLLRHIGARRAARSRGLRRPRAAVGRAPGQILAIEPVAPDVRIVRVARPPGFDYRAGQHVKLGAAGKSHSYSIASAPADPELVFCIELVPGGRVTPALFGLGAGDRLELGDRAKGKLLLDTAAEVHLMIATVTGIAPMRGIVRDALDRVGPDRRFIIVHGASYGDELPFAGELAALAETDSRVSYVPTISRPGEPRNAGWIGATGRAHLVASELAEALDPAVTRVYAAGHPEMVAAAERDLAGRGFAVSTEAFA